MIEKKLYISENCVSEKLENELIILDLGSGLYHSLNETGSIIWQEIENKNPSCEDLKTIISQQFHGKDITNDCDSFVDELTRKKLIFLK